MDIGHEVRRYRAEPIESPVPREAAVEPPAEAVVETEPVSTGRDESSTPEVAAEATA